MKETGHQIFRKISLNNHVKVKLTMYGELIYFVKTGFNPVKDMNGYTKFVLWKFMDIYGSFFNTESAKKVIENLDIYILEKDLEEVTLQ